MLGIMTDDWANAYPRLTAECITEVKLPGVANNE